MRSYLLIMGTFIYFFAILFAFCHCEQQNLTNNDFINRVHQLSASVSKNLVIQDTKVVWSPFSVVNVMSVLDNYTDLNNGFSSSITYLNSEPGLNMTLLSSGYTKNKNLLNISRNVNFALYPENKNPSDLLQLEFLKLTDFNNTSNTYENSSGTGTELNNKTNIVLTGLGIESLWETPFHPRYAKKSRFFLNQTHVVKTKFMNNIGFYKLFDANFSLFNNSLNADSIAVPLRNTHKTFLILMKPIEGESIENLAEKIDAMNFTDVWSGFKTTRRVQLSVPKFNIDSQFLLPLENATTLLQISSLKLSYTGLYNNFRGLSQKSAPLKFTRLRRRKDDIRYKLNSPFLFYLYDSEISGVLLSGLVLNPLSETDTFVPIPSIVLEPEVKITKANVDSSCFKKFSDMRGSLNIYENFLISCLHSYNNGSDNGNYSKMIGVDLEKSFEYHIGFESFKKSMKKFYTNEVEYFNASFFEIGNAVRMRYLSYGLFDMKVVQIKNLPGHRSIYFLIPNERSGLSAIEEGLEKVPFNSILCQMRDVHLRFRIPYIDFKNFSLSGINMDSHSEEVPIDRRDHARKRKNGNKRYRKLNLDRPFIYIVTEDFNTNGGIVAMGRIVNQTAFDFEHITGAGSGENSSENSNEITTLLPMP